MESELTATSTSASVPDAKYSSGFRIHATSTSDTAKSYPLLNTTSMHFTFARISALNASVFSLKLSMPMFNASFVVVNAIRASAHVNAQSLDDDFSRTHQS